MRTLLFGCLLFGLLLCGCGSVSKESDSSKPSITVRDCWGVSRTLHLHTTTLKDNGWKASVRHGGQTYLLQQSKDTLSVQVVGRPTSNLALSRYKQTHALRDATGRKYLADKGRIALSLKQANALDPVALAVLSKDFQTKLSSHLGNSTKLFGGMRVKRQKFIIIIVTVLVVSASPPVSDPWGCGSCNCHWGRRNEYYDRYEVAEEDSGPSDSYESVGDESISQDRNVQDNKQEAGSIDTDVDSYIGDASHEQHDTDLLEVDDAGPADNNEGIVEVSIELPSLSDGGEEEDGDMDGGSGGDSYDAGGGGGGGSGGSQECFSQNPPYCSVYGSPHQRSVYLSTLLWLGLFALLMIRRMRVPRLSFKKNGKG